VGGADGRFSPLSTASTCFAVGMLLGWRGMLGAGGVVCCGCGGGVVALVLFYSNELKEADLVFLDIESRGFKYRKTTRRWLEEVSWTIAG
jgi:hypothetical protein